MAASSVFSWLLSPLTGIGRLLPADTLADMVVSSVDTRSDAVQLEEALMVRLANLHAPTMYAQEIVDTLPGADPNHRLGYQISPFSRLTAGAVDVVTAVDENNETYVLLGRKENSSEWVMPAGYMQPAPAFNAQGAYTHNTEKRDRYEAAYVEHGRPPAFPIETLSKEIPAYDRTQEDTAVRELKEEAQIDIDKSQVTFVKSFVGSGKAKTIQGDQPYQGIDGIYLIDLRKQGKLPFAQGSDDLESVKWVKLKDFEMRRTPEGTQLVVDGLPVSKHYREPLEASIAKMRTMEYEALGVSQQGILSYMTERKPESELGPDAARWHEEALKVAQSMARLRPAPQPSERSR